jgi:hypothetical protein
MKPFIAIMLIFSFVMVCIVTGVKADHAYDQKTFNAWEKLTGNPRRITFDEFVILKTQKLINAQ